MKEAPKIMEKARAVAIHSRDLVSVLWEDSATKSGWHSSDGSTEFTIGVVLSRGMVVAVDDDQLVLSTSVSDTGMVLDPVSIPWSCIKNIELIEPAEGVPVEN